MHKHSPDGYAPRVFLNVDFFLLPSERANFHSRVPFTNCENHLKEMDFAEIQD